jgi:hypothetical protein
MTSQDDSLTSDTGYFTAEEPISKRTRRRRSHDDSQSRKAKVARVGGDLSTLVAFQPVSGFGTVKNLAKLTNLQFNSLTSQVPVANLGLPQHDSEVGAQSAFYNGGGIPLCHSPTSQHQGWICPPPTGGSSPLSELTCTPSLASHTDRSQEGKSTVVEASELLRRLEELLIQQHVSFAARETEVARKIEEGLQAKQSLHVEKMEIKTRCLNLVNQFISTE